MSIEKDKSGGTSGSYLSSSGEMSTKLHIISITSIPRVPMAVRYGFVVLAGLILGGGVWKYKRELQLVVGYINSTFECKAKPSVILGDIKSLFDL